MIYDKGAFADTEFATHFYYHTHDLSQIHKLMHEDDLFVALTEVEAFKLPTE